MAISQDLQTRIIVTAQDRGATVLLKKMAAEADATIDKFSQLGSALGSLMSGLAQGFAVKRALSVVEDYEMTVLSIATTLTDTLKNTNHDIGEAFKQNKEHARSFFNLLQTQAAKSISTFEDLQRAYMMFANVGLALSPNQENAQMLANVVDRLRLLTRGQNQEQQVIQELRALLRGQARPSDQLALMLSSRDVNFKRNIKQIVGQGDANELLSYLNSLMADIDLSSELSKMLSKAWANVSTQIRLMVIETFTPVKDEIVALLDDIGNMVGADDSPFKRGMQGYADTLKSIISAIREAALIARHSTFIETFIESAPKLLLIATAAKTAAIAFGALKAAVLSFNASMSTLVGGAIALYAIGDFAQTWAMKQPTMEQADEKEKTYSFIADGINGIISILRALGEEIPTILASFFDYIITALKAEWQDLVYGFYSIPNDIYAFLAKIYNSIVQFLNDVGYTIAGLFNIRYEPAGKISEESGWLKEERDKAYNETVKLYRESAYYHDKLTSAFVDFYNSMLDKFEGFQRERSSGPATVTKKQGSAEAITGRPAGSIPVAGSISDLKTGMKEINATLKNIQSFYKLEDSALRTLVSGNGLEHANASTMMKYDAIFNRLRNQNENTAYLRDEQSKLLIEGFLDKYNRLLAANSDFAVRKKAGGDTSEIEELILKLTKALSEELPLVQAQLHHEEQMRIDSARKANERARSEELRRNAVSAADEQLSGFASMASGSENSLLRQLGIMAETMMRVNEIQTKHLGYAETESEAKKRHAEWEKRNEELARQICGELERQLERQKKMSELMKSGGVFDAFTSGLMRYEDANRKTDFEHYEQLSQDLATAVRDELATALSNFFMEGDFDIGSFLAGVGEAMVNSIANMIADQIVMTLVNAITGTAPANATLMASATGAALALDALAASAASASSGMMFSGMFGMADGAVNLKGGWTPIRAFATGGTVTRPTIGIIGEAGMNEAVVPLPDGRSIPVALQGKASPNVVVNIVDKSGSGTSKSVEQEIGANGETILNIVIDAANRNTRGFKSKMRTALEIGK